MNYFPDEGLDLDPNYDPSDFLMGRNQNDIQVHGEDLHMGLRDAVVTSDQIPTEIQDDLAVSESDDDNHEESRFNDVRREVDEAEEGDLWF